MHEYSYQNVVDSWKYSQICAQNVMDSVRMLSIPLWNVIDSPSKIETIPQKN